MKQKSKRMIAAAIAWMCVIAWCVFIYSMSADNGTESGEKSGEVVDFVAGVVIPGYEEMTKPEKAEAVKPLSFPIRKLAHIAEYTVLGVLTAIAVRLTLKTKMLWLTAGLPFLLGTAYAFSDELHQSIVPGRGPSVWDVCIDAIGVALGVAAVVLVIEYILDKQEKKTDR